ncbi:MAG: M48 family metallopeptidase [Actinomycetota bacterium]
MYELIAANRRRSVFLVVSFVLLVAALGFIFGLAWDVGYFAAVAATAVAVVASIFAYYRSDKIVLRISHARAADPADPNQARLINITEGLSIAAGIPVPGVYVIDDEAPNAFATGRDPKHAAIAATTGLLQKMNRVELEGVIAHELSHIRNYDILVTTIAVVLAGLVTLMSDWMLRGFWRVGGRRRSGGAIVGVLGLVAALLAPLIAQMIRMALSRRREMLADSTGVMLTRYPPGLVSALKKLRDDSTVVRTGSRATAHLWIESPLHRSGSGVLSWTNRLFDTHPPIEERIRILESL